MSDSNDLRRPRAHQRGRQGTGPLPGAPAGPLVQVPAAGSATGVPAPTVLDEMRRTWRRSSAVVVAGLFAGLAYSQVLPPSYTAETRLSVGSQELSAQAVPGYVLAMQTMTSNYARYVSNAAATRTQLSRELGSATKQITEVDASPIPESNVLRLEVSALSPEVATEAAAALSKSMIAKVSASSTTLDAKLSALTDVTNRYATARQAEADAGQAWETTNKDSRVTNAQRDSARQALVDATAAADVLEVQQQAAANEYTNAQTDSGQPATLTVVQAAAITKDSRLSTIQRYGVLGLILGAGLAVGLAWLRGRSRSAPERDARHDQDDDAQPPMLVDVGRTEPAAAVAGQRLAPPWLSSRA